VGYSLTGSVAEQVLFVLHGTGANGKSTFSETVRSLLGDYAQQTPADTLLERRDSAIPNDIARLRGARFISAVESEEGKRLAEGMVKQLTGGDVVTARFMRAEFFEFKPVGKIWLATNHLPKVHGTDEAIWRRIRLVPFTVTIPEAERDAELGEKLRAELAGVLQWAVLGCLEWRQRKLGKPKAIAEATADYRAGQDLVGPFIEQICVLDPNSMEEAGKLYEVYEAWAKAAGEPVLRQRTFGDRLTERGLAKGKFGKRNRVHWFGLRIARGDDTLMDD
jgi:putative DNA primase/helicase